MARFEAGLDFRDKFINGEKVGHFFKNNYFKTFTGNWGLRNSRKIFSILLLKP